MNLLLQIHKTDWNDYWMHFSIPSTLISYDLMLLIMWNTYSWIFPCNYRLELIGLLTIMYYQCHFPYISEKQLHNLRGIKQVVYFAQPILEKPEDKLIQRLGTIFLVLDFLACPLQALHYCVSYKINRH